MKRATILAFVCCLPLAACASWQEPEDQPAPHSGEAVQNNIAVQIANPNPVPVEKQTMNGERAALAQDRYAKGKTIPPEDMDQASQGSGGGGGPTQ